MCKLLKKVASLFDKKAIVEKVAPSKTKSPVPAKGVVALVVGHNEKAQGAVNYLKESEWSFSSRILRKVQTKLVDQGYICYIIFRPSGRGYSSQVRSVVDQCKKLNITHVILSHFNSAGKGARGCEFLISESSNLIDNKMADMASDLLNERLGIKERKDDGVYVVSRNHRGSGMMYALHKAGIYNTLAEPVFAGYKTPESQAIFENEDAYVDILKEVAESCCNGTIGKYKLGK